VKAWIGLNLARRLVELRKHANMSLDELARALGLKSKTTIWRWEHGLAPIPHQYIKAMADVMRFHVRYFDMPPGAPLPKLSIIRFRKRSIFISHCTGWSGEEARILEKLVQTHNFITDARLNDPFQVGLFRDS
jgi:transcriptional regulator with XRE-family HTH domain